MTRLKVLVGSLVAVVVAIACLAPTAQDEAVDFGATALGGIGFGPFNGSVPTAPFTIYLNANTPGSLKAELAAARLGRYRVIAVTAGGSHSNYEDSKGHWSFNLWKQYGYYRYLADSATWRGYAGDGTLAGVSLIDEPQCASCWGGTAIPWVLVDSAAKLSKVPFRGVPHFTRTAATQFNGYPFRHLDGGMLQYSASMGDVAAWTAAQVAAAKRYGYALVAGVNAANGGARFSGCKAGSIAGACVMTGGELQRYLPVIGKDSTVVCALTAWGPNAAWWDWYRKWSTVPGALGYVSSWAAKRPRPVCLRR
jgi:hypothetical protein